MEKRKRIIVSVSNDLFTDQRVKKVCAFLHENGFEVILLGRKLKNSLDITDRPYRVKRFRLWFNKGPLFYANLNLRLFFFLWFTKADWLLANDLDTLPANYQASRFKRKVKLVYDSHEVFCEVPELQNSRIKKNTWLRFEKKIFPKLKKVYTVNDSIAQYYFNLYGIQPLVVRNISDAPKDFAPATRKELGLPASKFIVIIQGSGINVQRGNEEMVQAMQHLDENFLLLVVGGGDVIPHLKEYVQQNGLTGKVWFRPRMPYNELLQYTAASDLGVSMDKDTNLNYRFSLPNKLFDFIHMGVPVLASDLPEVAKVVNDYQVGIICPSHKPITIAQTIRALAHDREKYAELKENCKKAASELNWENEKQALRTIYEV